jgi:Flp pilus assembly CpaE family ATPase
LHSSYGALNRAIFEVADRILVPVTPDLPSIRAAVQLREFAVELGFVDRLAITVNRARSGIAVAEIERTTGLPAFALIRSGGMLFVRSANEGRTVIQMFPKEGVTKDFVALAARVAGAEGAKVANGRGRPGFRLLTRPREGARA